MNDDNGIFGEILETAGTAAKQTGKAVANAAAATVQTAASQVGVPVADNSQSTPSQDVSPQVSNEDIVESLYEKSAGQNAAAAQPAQPAVKAQDPSIKSPEELAQMDVVRKRLHDEYYQTLVNPAKQEEESVSEKLEREDKQEDMELQQKEAKKPPDLAVQRAQTHAEQNPGASG
ncbi:MAG: hypothetical protein WD992_01430 [Candidatus Levyibacteriota bacterium]